MEITIQEFKLYGWPAFRLKALNALESFYIVAEIIESEFKAVIIDKAEGPANSIFWYKIKDLLFEFSYGEDYGIYLTLVNKINIVEQLTEEDYRNNLNLNDKKEIIEQITGEPYDENNFNFDDWIEQLDDMDFDINNKEYESVKRLANKIAEFINVRIKKKI